MKKRKCCPFGWSITVVLWSLLQPLGRLSAQNRVMSNCHGGAEFEAMAMAVPTYFPHLEYGESLNLSAHFLSFSGGGGIWGLCAEIAHPVGSIDVLYGSSVGWVTNEQCWNLGCDCAFGEQWTLRLGGGVNRYVCPGESPFVIGKVQAGGYYRPGAHCLCFVEGDNLSLSRCRGLDFSADFSAGVMYEVSDNYCLSGRVSKQLQRPIFLHFGMKKVWPLTEKFHLAAMTGLRYPYIRPSLGFEMGCGAFKGLICSVWDFNLGPTFGMTLSCAI